MRSLPVIALALLLIAAADPCPEPPDPDGGDAKKILGTWDVTQLTLKGAANPTGTHKIRMTFERGKVTISSNGMEKTATWKIDQKKKPKEIDLTLDKDKKTAPGIYELDGDILKLTVGDTPGATRPRDFVGSTSVVITLRREKKK